MTAMGEAAPVCGSIIAGVNRLFLTQLTARHGRRLARLLVGWLLMAAGLAACTPTYDWREQVVEGDLTLWLPCKPHRLSRDVPLAGQTVPMVVYGCEAGGQSWALSSVGDVEPAAFARVQQALDAALAANLTSRLDGAGVPAAPGLAQTSGLRSHELHGHRPDGAAVVVTLWSFARGSRVYQASVMRVEPVADAAAAQDARRTFFGALRFGR